MIASAPVSSSRHDVIVVGAGPAGAVAATIMARAGARVVLIDRATFPRPKLCGDTLNPGALAVLRGLGLAGVAERRGLPVEGMLVTGASGLTIEGRYPDGQVGRAITRADLDLSLVEAAVVAGAELVDGTTVRRPIVQSEGAANRVFGVSCGGADGKRDFHAPVTIAADGRHSTLAFALGLARHPPSPRRWAIGAYVETVPGQTTCGEMHVRAGRYIGVAAVPGGLTNVCLVRPVAGREPALGHPLAVLKAELAADRVLRDRFAHARFVVPPVVLGPLAVEVTRATVPDGLLLAGDAGGFVDPMTGDGLRFALRGGELAAAAALRALQQGWSGVQAALAEDRRRAFHAKWRFNRTLRGLVGSPIAVRAATIGARFAPGVVRAIIARAGDCDTGRAGDRIA
jgi:menaquinone-9 beta-reductase